MLMIAPATKSATCVAVCGGWRSKQEEAEDIFQFGLIHVCDLGFKSAIIVCSKFYLNSY